MRRASTTFGILLISLAIAPSAFAAFQDVPTSYWARGYVDMAAEANMMSGYNATTFGPDNTLTRAEAVKIVLKGLNATVLDTTTQTFPDVAKDHSLHEYVEEAYAREIITGYEDGTFKPNRPVTRAEFVKILMVAADEVDTAFRADINYSDVSRDSWYFKYVYSAAVRHYVNGLPDGSFKPDITITRSQAAKILVLFTRDGVLPDFAIPANSSHESYLLTLINESRTAAGKTPLSLNARISLIARTHSANLAKQYNNVDKVQWQQDNPDATPPWISHVGPDGKDFQDRFSYETERLGITYRTASENVVWATFRSRTIDEALKAMHDEMMRLPDATSSTNANQKSNIMSQFNPYTEIGIGIEVDEEKQEITMTQEFIDR